MNLKRVSKPHDYTLGEHDEGKMFYVPISNRVSFMSWKSLRKNTRPFRDEDSGKCRVKVLIAHTRGNGEWESFQGFSVNECDVNKVGRKFVDLFVISVSDEQGNPVAGYPLRVKKDNIRVRVLTQNPKPE